MCKKWDYKKCFFKKRDHLDLKRCSNSPTNFAGKTSSNSVFFAKIAEMTILMFAKKVHLCSKNP